MELTKKLWGTAGSFFNSLGSFLKGLGGTLTAVAVAVVGIYGSDVLDRSRARDSDAQLYAQLMSKREDAETLLRKDMFNSIIGTFLKTSATGYPYEQQVLNLELLAYNFHEALDLAPLFKHVYMDISNSKDRYAGEYMHRLEKVAGEVKTKQIAALEESGGKLDGAISIEDLNKVFKEGEGLPVLLDGVILPSSRVFRALDPALQETKFKVEVISTDTIKKEIRVKLEVRQLQQAADSKDAPEETASTFNFTVSPFDFPMIDNTRLPRGQRCALVVRNFDERSISITLVYFPGSRASLKEKPFYDEAMHELLYTRTLLDKERAK
jgi:hypothetical protein